MTWADIDTFYTDLFANTDLRRDRAADAVAESPGGTSRVAVWAYKERWDDDGLAFVVMFTIVRTRDPGKTYRFLSIMEPNRPMR